MTDRRNHRRFVLTESAGEIRLLYDVVLESVEGQIVSVIACAPSAEGEELLLHISSRSGSAETLTVRTVESMPVCVNDEVRHRIRFRIVSPAAERGPVRAAAWATRAEDDVVACTLVRRAAARVVDVSARGCLLETQAAVTVGATALFDIMVDGRPYIEVIRVCRTMSLAGTSGRFRAGAEFLPTFEGASRSIRPLVAQLEIVHSGLVSAGPESDSASARDARAGRRLFWQ